MDPMSLPRNDPWLRRTPRRPSCSPPRRRPGQPGRSRRHAETEPKPKLELLTASQEEALLKGAVKVEVRSKRGDEVRVKAILVVDGFPDNFTFKLGPESKGCATAARR